MAFAIFLAICIPILLGFALLRRRARRAGKSGRGYATAGRTETPDAPGGKIDLSEFPCAHERPAGDIVVKVFGADVTIHESPLCAACIGAYLNKYAARCAMCSGPILPGEPVGQAWGGAPHPHTHLTFDCCDSGGLFCGRWGQGRLITLHELEPETYPAGTTTVMAHAFNTGQTTFVNID